MADVFISYARSTAGSARELAELLEKDGRSVWFDGRLPAHRVYADVIQEQLDAAKAAVIIWSHDAVGSQWVRSEANRAREKGTLVQVRLDDCALPMPFDQIQCPSLEGWKGDPSYPAFEALLASVADLVDGPTRAQRLAAADGHRDVRPRRDAEAQLLFDAAMKALQSGEPGEHAQAIPLLIEATSIAPADPEAWGLLAVLYATRRYEVAPSERRAMIARARSAIRSALALDPNNVRAGCAEAILIRPYRNWERKELAARQVLDRVPDHPLALFSLATVLAHEGRWTKAASVATRISRSRFLLPAVEQFTVQALWSAGDIVRAELAGDRAARRFPAHAGLWEARLAVLMHSGRTADALVMIDNTQARPPGYCARKLETLSAMARALARTTAAGEAVQRSLAAVEDRSLAPLVAAQHCAVLGHLDECFALLDGYYFDRGPWSCAAPEGGDEDRSTAELFLPTMTALWADPRFAGVTEQIGLGDCWARSGNAPDFLAAT